MKLIEFPEQNLIIAKDQPEYLPMPAFADGQRVICVWSLTWKERLRVLFFGRIWHEILTFGGPVQPQLLHVRSPFVKPESP